MLDETGMWDAACLQEISRADVVFEKEVWEAAVLPHKIWVNEAAGWDTAILVHKSLEMETTSHS